MYLSEAMDSFLRFRASYCGAVTMEGYERNLLSFCRYLEGATGYAASALPVDRIGVDELAGYQSYLRKKTVSRTGKALASRSVVTYMTDVRTFFNYLVDFDILEKSPMKKVRILKKSQKQLAPLTINEAAVIDRCFDLATVNGLRNYLMFHLYLDCGLRRSESFNLCWEDIHFAESYLFVKGKGRKERFVPLPASIAARLKDFLILYVFDTEPRKRRVFTLADGRPFTDNALKDVYSRLKQKTGIQRLHPHFLRHTFATSYIVSGGDVLMLREILGHYDVEITQHYVHEAAKLKIIKYPIYPVDKIFTDRRCDHG